MCQFGKLKLKYLDCTPGRGLILYQWRIFCTLILFAGIHFTYLSLTAPREEAANRLRCECQSQSLALNGDASKLASGLSEIQKSEEVDFFSAEKSPSNLPSSSILHDPAVYLPQPCYKGMEEVNHRDVDWSQWTAEEIDTKRADWQTWYTVDMSKLPTSEYSVTMEKIDDVLRDQGVISGRDSYLDYTSSFPRNRGIVITASHVQQMNYLTAQIELLRSNGCKLPIEVWGFPHEMNDELRQSINKLAQPAMPVIVRVADEKVPWPITRGSTNGYHIKAVAVVNSAFREVLYLDVDVMPTKNPEELFNCAEYIKYGTIFWVDYWKTHPFNPVWRWLGRACVDEWEQESGILVVDRARAWNALRLLWYFERDDDIRLFHEFLHGDKDLFRFSWQVTNTPVYWIPHWVTPGGFLPDPENPTEHCGISMIQFDPNGVPAFAHVNFFKQTNMANFTQASPMLTHIKRYKKPPLEKFQFPPGPYPGTKMRWGHTRGHLAGFVGIGEFVCVDLGNAEGIALETEVIPIKFWHPTFQDDLFRLLGRDLVEKSRGA